MPKASATGAAENFVAIAKPSITPASNASFCLRSWTRRVEK